MTNHPLTDDLAEDIASTEFEFPFGIGETVFTYNDMRKAANWQLEEVLNFIAADPMLGRHVADYIHKAMRPQENQ